MNEEIEGYLKKAEHALEVAEELLGPVMRRMPQARFTTPCSMRPRLCSSRKGSTL
jgi:hypothetical protein